MRGFAELVDIASAVCIVSGGYKKRIDLDLLLAIATGELHIVGVGRLAELDFIASEPTLSIALITMQSYRRILDTFDGGAAGISKVIPEVTDAPLNGRMHTFEEFPKGHLKLGLARLGGGLVSHAS